MARIVIADAGPLIAFAGTDSLELLHRLFGEVWITGSVERECLAKPGSDAHAITSAIEAGWLIVRTAPQARPSVSGGLGSGEIESIQLAMESSLSSLLVLDDRLARRRALHHGLNIIGTVRLLDLAEKKSLIVSAEQLIQEMREHGYRIAPNLLQQIRGEIPGE